jgi:hypothetical protein
MLRRAVRVAAPMSACCHRAAGASRHATLLAALVERSPVITPEISEWDEKQLRHKAALEAKQKVSPTVLTAAEEGPDQQRARLRMESLVARESTREGEGDRTGDMRSLDRRLAQRLYLLVKVDGRWQLPQDAWAAPEAARDGLRRVITARCGEDLATHQMGNAPLGHVDVAGGVDALFLWRHLYVSGDVRVGEGEDYAWVTKDELVEYVDDDLAQIAPIVCGPFP